MWGRAWGLQCTGPQAQRLGVDWDLDLGTCCLLLCITWLLNWTETVEWSMRVVSTLTTCIFICHPSLQSTSCMGENAYCVKKPFGVQQFPPLSTTMPSLSLVTMPPSETTTTLNPPSPIPNKMNIDNKHAQPDLGIYILSIQLSYNANDWYDFISFSFNQRHERNSRWKNLLL